MNNTLIENSEDLDIIMLMYNLLEYSQNYSMTSGSLWNYYRDEINNIKDNASDGKSFKYKTKIVGKTTKKSSLTWQSRRFRPTTTTSSINFNC